MKKLSLLIVIALLLSIGGVYATWTYAGAGAAENHQHVSINLAVATTDAPEGIIHRVDPSLDIRIDDSDRDYEAELVITGQMGFVFMPSDGASADIIQNGIPLQWQLEQRTPIKHGGEEVFIINQATPVALTATKIEDGHALYGSYPNGFYVEVTAEQVKAVLDIDLELPTFAEYQAFQGEIATGALGLTISKAPATQSGGEGE